MSGSGDERKSGGFLSLFRPAPKPEPKPAVDFEARARRQRDEARRQREEARAQRDVWRARFLFLAEKLDPELLKAATDEELFQGEVETLLADLWRTGGASRAQDDPITSGDAFALAAARAADLREEGFDDATPGPATSVPYIHRRPVARRAPGRRVAFVTVTDHLFTPGLIGLLLSMRDVYPDLDSDFHVLHDESLTAYDRFRLKSVYPGVVFSSPDMSWLDLPDGDSKNRRRIGKNGYMKFSALDLDAYDRVILLDSDITLHDDISALWSPGDDVRCVADFGETEYAQVSAFTGREIVNSGVLSLPRDLIARTSFEAAKPLISRFLAPVDPAIDRFADQKIWNILLKDEPVTYLPANYNCNVKYAGRLLGLQTDNISVLHFAGPKPWLFDPATPRISAATGRSVRFPSLWFDRVRPLLFRNRAERLAGRMAHWRESRAAGLCLLCDDLSTLAAADRYGEDAASVWFARDGDAPGDGAAAPDHVVLGWSAFAPQTAENPEPRLEPWAIDAVEAFGTRPVVWAPLATEFWFASSGRFRDNEIRYLLHEAPFNRFVDVVGASEFDPGGFLDSARLDCLTYGAPIAKALGCSGIVVLSADPTRPAEACGAFVEGLDTRALPEPAADADRIRFVAEILRRTLAAQGLGLFDDTPDNVLGLPRRA
jgi:lipopolysaccharide biosynthesis glycosyltransferase